MNSFDMAASIGYNILDVARLMSRHFDDMSGEVTMAQGLVLYHLDKKGTDCLIQQDLAEILNINKSGLLRTIDILEKKGFLKRVPVVNDRRKNQIEITPAGHAQTKLFEKELMAKNAQLKAGLTDTEITTLFKVLALMKEKLNSM